MSEQVNEQGTTVHIDRLSVAVDGVPWAHVARLVVERGADRAAEVPGVVRAWEVRTSLPVEFGRPLEPGLWYYASSDEAVACGARLALALHDYYRRRSLLVDELRLALSAAVDRNGGM